MTGRDPGPRYTDGIRRQVVEVCGIPVELDETLPRGTFAIRTRDGQTLGQWETTTVENDPAVASFVAHRLLDNDDGRYVPVSGPGDPPAGTNLLGLGPLEQHLRTGGRAGDYVEQQPQGEIHRPRLRQLTDRLWLDVDEIVGIETRVGDMGWPQRIVEITTRGRETYSVTVPGIEQLDDGTMATADVDAAADQSLERWLAQRFGDIIGTDALTLAVLDDLFGLKP